MPTSDLAPYFPSPAPDPRRREREGPVASAMGA
jgi:hypothetical protein